MYKKEAAKVKCYQVVGCFQAKIRTSADSFFVLFLSEREKMKLFISKKNCFDTFRGFL